ncbi:hypothetical protein [Goodfellowiella coeruleoviolacea]|nr:hypothetical protein [Goodfellowiella coeruleoviolacea]
MSQGQPVTVGGMWIGAVDAEWIKYKIEDGGEFADVTFGGAVDVTLGMSEAAARRCRDLLDRALAEMAAVRAASADSAEG